VLWAGTDEGLNYLNRETRHWHTYKHDPEDPTSLSHNWVWAIHKDRTGRLWVGTLGGGLNRFDPEEETFAHYGEQDGLASDLVLDILEDDHGFLWLGTANGLSRFDPQSETFTNHGVDRRLPITDFNAAMRSPNGEMFFGGVNGFVSFFPDQIQETPYVPAVVLTSLQQQGRNMELGLAPEDMKQIVLSWPDDSFEFEFAALSFSQPERNQHAYKLEGFDEEWLYSQYGRYTNLPGGTYTLRLKGSNNDGVWNEAGASIEVVVVPPFWETWWFRGAVVLALVAVGFAAYRLRVRGLETRSRELERQVEDRTAKLTDANIRLYQEIEERERAEEELAQQRAETAVAEERNRLARDLHDSVTQSIYSLTLLSEAGKRMAEARDLEQLTMNQSRIGDISQQALQEMRLLVYELRPLELETEGLVGALGHRLEVVEKRAGIDARLIVEDEPELPAELEEELYRIAQEALNNALKHAQASTIIVVFRVDAETVSLQVQDDGRGFEPETVQASGGLGLTTMAERAEMINGRLTIRSSPNEGTIVRIEVHQ
jgi:signal transduction histidine kinase